MTITIQNICGGDRYKIRSVAALARIAATNRRYGGWEVVEWSGIEGLSLDEARAVLQWADPTMWRQDRRAKTARDWREVAAEAIRFGRG